MIEVKIVVFLNSFQDEITKIRHAVFSQEQSIDHDIDFDGLDVSAWHALLRLNGQFVGTGRILADGHIGRVAILKEHRCLGLGQLVVQALISHAQENSYPRVYLGAQHHAIDFYTKLGFSTYGAEYIEVGIKHMPMEKGFN